VAATPSIEHGSTTVDPLSLQRRVLPAHRQTYSHALGAGLAARTGAARPQRPSLLFQKGPPNRSGRATRRACSLCHNSPLILLRWCS
jgi:hypothetical protein